MQSASLILIHYTDRTYHGQLHVLCVILLKPTGYVMHQQV